MHLHIYAGETLTTHRTVRCSSQALKRARQPLGGAEKGTAPGEGFDYQTTNKPINKNIPKQVNTLLLGKGGSSAHA